MNPVEDEKNLLFVHNIEPFVQKQALKEYQEKKNAAEMLTIHVPKSIIQREVIRLCDLQREAIIKLFWENLDVHEIAYQMKLSRKSVQKLIETALLTIRRRLTSEETASPA